MKRLMFVLISSLVLEACVNSDNRAPAPPTEESTAKEGKGIRVTDASYRAVDNDATASRGNSQASNKSVVKDATADTTASLNDASADDALLAPSVQILAPNAANDPNQDAILVQAPVKVRCQVKKSPGIDAAEVDAHSVIVELISESTAVQKKVAVAAEEGIYEAIFERPEIPVGKLSIRCSAKDTATKAHWACDEITTFFDAGPTIEVLSPQPDTQFPLSEPVTMEFRVSALPIYISDRESDVDTVTALLAGVTIPIKEIDGDPGHYRTSIDFSDTALFSAAPNGSIPVLIAATNKRTPQPAQATANYRMIVDGRGPTITIDNPKNGDVVGGKVKLSFSVSDMESSVDPKSIVVQFDGQNHLFDAPGESWSRQGNSYTYRFDTRAITGSKVQLTIQVNAKDVVGNASSGDSILVLLDNQSPVIDLDPPNVRERKKNGNKLYCSYSFDPVGESATNDGDRVQSMALFRAMVWDRTNTAPGQTNYYYSRTDSSKVFLYIQSDPAQPLLIDTNGDSICDDIAQGGLPSIQMTALTPTGNARFGPDKKEFTHPPAVPDYDPDAGTSPYCDVERAQAPQRLCASQTSDLSRVVSHRIPGNKEPVIYAVNVGKNASPACTGDRWELAPFARGGWMCLAVRAEDGAGNVGISRPLRVCLDAPDGGATPECQGDRPPIPASLTCSDGCTPPPSIADLHILDTPIDLF